MGAFFAACLKPLFDHMLDFERLFKVIKLMGLDPPLGGLHQQFRVVVFVFEKGIERQAHPITGLGDFGVADLYRLLPQTIAHVPSPFIFPLGHAHLVHAHLTHAHVVAAPWSGREVQALR